MADERSLGVGLIGVGAIAELVHHPGVHTVPNARVVAMSDTDSALLKRRREQWPGVRCYSEAEALLDDREVEAVVIATPNYLHRPLALAAIRAAKHVLCEKPIALDANEANQMVEAARAARLRHMTAFTYRFVPAMRYLKHILDRGDLGEPLHYRAQRFQDWDLYSLGWRQWQDTAGTGELGDMASHRIDYGRYLIGEIKSVCAMTKQFVPRDRDRNGQPVRPSDTEDWVGILIQFTSGVTGVIESSKLARGHGSGGQGHDQVEVGGSEASAIFQLRRPYELQIGRRGEQFQTVKVPEEFWKLPGSLRTAGEGDPSVVWRYDQELEFIQAIRQRRDCSPSFWDGLRCQQVVDAVVRSVAERAVIELE